MSSNDNDLRVSCLLMAKQTINSCSDYQQNFFSLSLSLSSRVSKEVLNQQETFFKELVWRRGEGTTHLAPPVPLPMASVPPARIGWRVGRWEVSTLTHPGYQGRGAGKSCRNSLSFSASWIWWSLIATTPGQKCSHFKRSADLSPVWILWWPSKPSPTFWQSHCLLGGLSTCCFHAFKKKKILWTSLRPQSCEIFAVSSAPPSV